MYEYYRNDQIDYEELVSGKSFDSFEALSDEMSTYGFKNHGHILEKDYESQLGGNHMFSLINDNDPLLN